MRVLITGAGGMVGRYMVEHCRAQNDQVTAHDRSSLDITDAASVSRAFDAAQPEIVFNCAAWTDVDGCESDVERAFAANSHGVETLAREARRHNALLVTISTDYVFDGEKDGFYTQRDDPQPTSVYGRAKLDGERRALAASARTIVVRTGWIYGAGGKNFLSFLADKARQTYETFHSGATVSNEAASMRAIADSYGMPTAASDLVVRLRELARLDLPGTYHVVGSGTPASFAEFGRAAFEFAEAGDVQIEDVSFKSLNRPAPRPRNSALRCLLSEAIDLTPLPTWREALRRFVRS